MAKEMATAEQKKIMGLLVKKLGIVDKDALVSGFTNFRTTSRGEMYFGEARALIAHLKSQDKIAVSCDKMRKFMIAMAYERAGLGRNASEAQKETAICHLDEWCVKYGQFHKGLNAHNYEELTALVTQYKKVYKTLLNSI